MQFNNFKLFKLSAKVVERTNGAGLDEKNVKIG